MTRITRGVWAAVALALLAPSVAVAEIKASKDKAIPWCWREERRVPRQLLAQH